VHTPSAMTSIGDSVYPGDSASNRSGSSPDLTFSQIGLMQVDMSRCVFTAEDYKLVIERGGKEAFNEIMANNNTAMSLMSRMLGMQSAALRSATSSSVSGDGNSTGTPSNGSGKARGVAPQRVQRLRAMTSWRKSVPDGLCYTKMMRTGSAPSEAERLGVWPTVASLLRSPLSSFQSLDDLERFRLVGDSESVHVKAGGHEGFSALGSLSWLAQSSKYPVGTLGAVVKATGVPPVPGLSLNHRTVVGGLPGSLSLGIQPCEFSEDKGRLAASSLVGPRVGDVETDWKSLSSFTSVPNRVWTSRVHVSFSRQVAARMALDAGVDRVVTTGSFQVPFVAVGFSNDLDLKEVGQRGRGESFSSDEYLRIHIRSVVSVSGYRFFLIGLKDEVGGGIRVKNVFAL